MERWEAEKLTWLASYALLKMYRIPFTPPAPEQVKHLEYFLVRAGRIPPFNVVQGALRKAIKFGGVGGGAKPGEVSAFGELAQYCAAWFWPNTSQFKVAYATEVLQGHLKPLPFLPPAQVILANEGMVNYGSGSVPPAPMADGQPIPGVPFGGPGRPAGNGNVRGHDEATSGDGPAYAAYAAYAAAAAARESAGGFRTGPGG